MSIFNITPKLELGNSTLCTFIFSCDCGNAYKMNGTLVNEKMILDYKFCPYCGKELKNDEKKIKQKKL